MPKDKNQIPVMNYSSDEDDGIDGSGYEEELDTGHEESKEA